MGLRLGLGGDPACSKEFDWKTSKPKTSRRPMNLWKFLSVSIFWFILATSRSKSWL